MTVCLLCVSIHIMFPSGQGLTASYVSNNFPDALYRSHLMSPHVISVYVPFHLRLLAGIGPTTKIDSRQGGSQNRIPTQWVWGIGCLNKYESLGYFFLSKSFSEWKTEHLGWKKSSQVSMHPSTIAPENSGMGDPESTAPGVPFRDPTSLKIRGSPRNSRPSLPKAEYFSGGRKDFPKPWPWVFQCPNFILVVRTYKNLLGLFWRQGKK